ncbi:hypothetical protein ACFSDC_16710, partial [Alteromonas oceani]
GFLRTLPLASNALAIRIIFPSVRVIQVSFNLTGLPASLGKQKNPAYFAGFLVYRFSNNSLYVEVFYVQGVGFNKGTSRFNLIAH